MGRAAGAGRDGGADRGRGAHGPRVRPVRGTVAASAAVRSSAEARRRGGRRRDRTCRAELSAARELTAKPPYRPRPRPRRFLSNPEPALPVRLCRPPGSVALRQRLRRNLDPSRRRTASSLGPGPSLPRRKQAFDGAGGTRENPTRLEWRRRRMEETQAAGCSQDPTLHRRSPERMVDLRSPNFAAEGRAAEADASLAEFRRRYPDHPLDTRKSAPR
jgi:hypothetical protein